MIKGGFMKSMAVIRSVFITSHAIIVFLLALNATGAAAEKEQAVDEVLARVDKQLEYLKSRSIDVDLQEEKVAIVKKELEKYKGWMSRLNDMKEGPEKTSAARETGMMRQVIELSLSGIELSLQDKIASVRRLDVLYLLTAVTGVGFVIGITFYTIWMYLKRR